ncbi:MAG: nucleotide exchange factor GrpE [Candidatus Aenigmarchaeota archaeon]|nr:nucleotide exchange factor GrpE [Candidatus Aenigmarchaeota archaeon]
MTKKDKKEEIETIETLKKQLEEKDAKLSEYEAEIHSIKDEMSEIVNITKQVKADFDNYIKRTEKEKQDTISYANEKIIIELLDILDNFERAMGEMKKTEETGKIKTGVELIFKQLYQLLKTKGVEEIEALEKQFDPKKHEALMQIVSGNHEEDTVIQIMQKGYMLKEKVIRPTKVAVSKKENKDKTGE